MVKQAFALGAIASLLFFSVGEIKAQDLGAIGGLGVVSDDTGVIADEDGMVAQAGDTGVVTDGENVAVNAGGTMVTAGANGVGVNAGGLIINVKDLDGMYLNLKGKIVLKVEDKGQAFYVHPKESKLYSLGKPNDAFAVMRQQGVGISNKDLEKIEVGTVGVFGEDTDKDGLSDLMEDAVATDKTKADTDGDGFNDKAEVEGNFNPRGAGKIKTDATFTNNQRGRIFIQTERNGEAWYVSPANKKRYFLGRPSDAFAVMRALGLGITNKDFNNI
jgi:hypothetical protein